MNKRSDDTGWLSATDFENNGPLKKKKKRECSYGEKCYRKAPYHFEEFEHPHLEAILEMIGDVVGDIRAVPEFYSPKISRETLIEQLNFERKSNPKFSKKSDPGTSSTVDKSSNKTDGNRSSTTSGEPRLFNSVPRSPKINNERSGQSLRKTLAAADTSQWKSCEKISEPKPDGDFKRTGDNSDKNIISSKATSQAQQPSRSSEAASSSSSSSGSTPRSTSSDVRSSSSRCSEENRRDAEKYRVVVWDRTKIKASDKLKAAAPYNIFLTTVTDSKPTHSEMLSVCLPELLDPTLGDLESSLQINFMVEFGWLLAQYHIMGHRCKPLTLIYGEVDMDLGDKFKHFLTHAKVIPPSAFGTHHTKMMVFSYKDGSMRIVVSTANLVESDWDNRTQGLWVSDKCDKLSDESDTAGGESRTGFKQSLLRYLATYQLPELQPWQSKIQRADLSKINVFFIGSVPGGHTTYKNHWGHLALARILRENVVVPARNSYQVIVQCSSIGSLGPKPESWLMGNMLDTFCSGKKMGLLSMPQLKFIYPSFENVANSHDGLLGGGCLPYSKKTHVKQEWLKQFLCQWKSDRRYRSKAPPHIKSYCRVSADLSRMSYFLLTSANMSKAAWGNHHKNGTLNILSYEAGVLLLPQFIIGEEFFPLKPIDGFDSPVFSLPYDLPVTPYSKSDIPWFIENLM